MYRRSLECLGDTEGLCRQEKNAGACGCKTPPIFEASLWRVWDAPRQNLARVPVHDCDQIAQGVARRMKQRRSSMKPWMHLKKQPNIWNERSPANKGRFNQMMPSSFRNWSVCLSTSVANPLDKKNPWRLFSSNLTSPSFQVCAALSSWRITTWSNGGARIILSRPAWLRW